MLIVSIFPLHLVCPPVCMVCLFFALSHSVLSCRSRLCLALAGPFKSQLAVRLLQSLRVSDAPRFYGLPSLERTLQGMVSLTAQAGWSSHCPDLEPVALCSKYLSGLLEVCECVFVFSSCVRFCVRICKPSTLSSDLRLPTEMNKAKSAF